jgi:hypothetical protein
MEFVSKPPEGFALHAFSAKCHFNLDIEQVSTSELKSKISAPVARDRPEA